MARLKNKKVAWDLLLILALLLSSLVAYLLVRATAREGSVVAVQVENQTVAEYPLGVNGEFSLLGGKNTLVIENGAAYIKESRCPDHLCERQGRITDTNGRIVCLPHRLTIKIK